MVSAPSGAGKTTLCEHLLRSVPNLALSVSYTTRRPRANEQHGMHYYFVSRQEFEEMLQRGEFLEWARVHGNLYGTSRRKLREMLQGGLDVLLDIDVQGAQRLRQEEAFKGQVVYIFVLPPSLQALRERLQGRLTEAPEEVALRLRNALQELRHYKLYDYVIVNDRLEEAVEALRAVVLARRLARINPQWVEDTFFAQGG